MVATFLVSEKGKKCDYMVNHFGLLFWDRDTRAYELKEFWIVFSPNTCAFFLSMA